MERPSGISFTLPAAVLELKAIDRQDVSGSETPAAPLLPDGAAIVESEKSLNTPTDRSDRSEEVTIMERWIIKHGWRRGNMEGVRVCLDTAVGHRRKARLKR